jgi:hypothetical protein
LDKIKKKLESDLSSLNNQLQAEMKGKKNFASSTPKKKRTTTTNSWKNFKVHFDEEQAAEKALCELEG